jgi:very-short-patch-repair endonuclease
VQRTFLALAASGRPGVEVMRAVLSERVDGYVPTRSALEQALDSVLATIGGIEFTREFALPSRAGDPHIVDRFLPQARLVVEADGRLWHGRLDAMERDRQRDRRAAALGLRTLRYGWRELVHEPDDVAAELSAIISAERIPHAG